ncbi:MAG: hypothetical protein RLZZ367_980 [Bacteroidota bacterium]
MNKAHFVLAVSMLMLLAACNPKHEWMKRSIEKQENAVNEIAKTGKVDSIAVTALVKDYEAFADAYPTDTLSAIYLFKAADFYRYLHQPLHSIQLYSRVYDNFPTFGRRPYALFLQGFIYENEANNPHAAKAMYEKFLQEYPNHVIAKDVRMNLKYLGKTPEQILAEFQAQAVMDSLAKADSLKLASGK